jgi:hypothetical protein
MKIYMYFRFKCNIYDVWVAVDGVRLVNRFVDNLQAVTTNDYNRYRPIQHSLLLDVSW